MYSIFTGYQAIYAPSGIGSSYLVINPRYQQEVNKAGQLEFTLTPENAVYGKLKKLTSPISLYHNNEEIFFGRVVSIEKDFLNHEHVTVEGALAFLHDAVIRPFKFEDSTENCIKNYLERTLKVYNRAVDGWKKIHVGNVTVTESNNYLMRFKDSYNDAYEVLVDHTINSTLSGFLSIRRQGGKTYLDYTEEAGEVSDQIIQFGQNLLDFTCNVSAENVYTVIIPIGKEINGKPTTIKEVNDGKDYIESKTGIRLFGRIERQVTFGEYTKPKWLRAAAVKALNKAIREAVSIEIKAVDLSLINPNIGGLKQGTMLRVYSEPHGLDEYMLCRKVDINLNEPDDAVYTLGVEGVTLSGQHASASRGTATAISNAENAVKETADGLQNELDKVREQAEQHDGAVRVEVEYCLANYRYIPAGMEFKDIQYTPWSSILPTYVAGKYYWTRTVTCYKDGTVVYGEPRFHLGGQVTAEALIAAQNATATADVAERIADRAESLANTKRRVFNSTPVPPYDANDMWFDGAHGSVYLCVNSKPAEGTFAQSDWMVYNTDVSNHFWVDPNGAHIAENQGDLTTGASQTIASSGTVMRQNGEMISSWTSDRNGNAAINFYDLSDTDLLASYGRAGITQYIDHYVATALTASGLSFFTPDATHNLEAVFGSSGVELYALGVLALALTSGSLKFYDTDGVTELAEFGANEAQIGKDAGPHTHIGNNGMQIYRNGSKELAHIGYGSTYTDSGVSDNPYYTFGSRGSGNIGAYSFVEGQNNVASGYYAHASGSQNTASGHYSHVEGGGITGNTAAGYASHVEGDGNTTTVNAHYAHVGGIGNTARYEAQTIIGKYAPLGDSDDLFVVGNGILSHPSAAMRLKDNGRVEFAGAVGTGLTWKSRSEMCDLMKDLKTMTPYNFSATWADTGSQIVYWGETAGAEPANCFGTICRINATKWHMMFMCNGNVYKSIFTWDGNGTTTGTFSTTLIG